MSYRKLAGRDVWVSKTRICGTRLVMFDAWEPSALMGGPHSTIMHGSDFGLPGGWLGKISTRRVDCDLPAYSDERLAAVQAEFSKRYAAAYAAIVEAYPEAAAGVRRSGSIDLVLEGDGDV